MRLFMKVGKLFSDRIENPIYSRKEGISYRAVEACRRFDEIEAEFNHSDYLTGRYKGVSFQSSRVALTVINDSETVKSAIEYAITRLPSSSPFHAYFDGIWFAFELDEESVPFMAVEHAVRELSEGYGPGGCAKSPPKGLEYAGIRYEVWTEENASADRLITPDLWKAIDRLRTRANAPILMIAAEREFHVGIWTQGDIRIPKSSKKDLVEATQKQFDAFLDTLLEARALLPKSDGR